MLHSSRSRSLLFYGLILSGILICGCNGDSPSEARPVDNLSIANTSPANGTTLRRGERIVLQAALEYTLRSAEAGRILMVIQDQTGQSIAAQGRIDITRGSNAALFAVGVNVPAEGVTRVDVLFSLTPEGASTSTAAQSLRYSVQ
jgi:hypothetical protein